MNPIWTQVVIQTVLKNKRKSKSSPPGYSRFTVAKGFLELRVLIKSGVRSFFLILLGISSAAFGLKSFLLPNDFIDGGATGISLLVSEVTGLHLSILLVLINIPFLLMGLNVIGKSFAIKSSLAIAGLAAAVGLFTFPQVTDDKLLVAVFGGFFLGAGIGLSIRGGGVLDGTEVLAIFLSKRVGATVGDIIMIINVIIFLSGAFLLSIETVLYSMLTYLAASKTLDFVIEGIEEYTGVTIISPHSEDIRTMITEKLGRGVTIYKGKRGYGKTGSKDDLDIVYTVITRLEVSKLNTEIEIIDPNAFVITSSVKDTRGGMIKKRPLAH